jgi:hypothetical protein
VLGSGALVSFALVSCAKAEMVIWKTSNSRTRERRIKPHWEIRVWNLGSCLLSLIVFDAQGGAADTSVDAGGSAEGGSGGREGVLRLRRAIRFANGSATLRMTI